MKRISTWVLPLSLLACLWTACKQDVEIHSPDMVFSTPKVNSQPWTNRDTLYVGDTLQIGARLNPYYNTLVSFQVLMDRNYMKDSLMSTTEYEEGFDTQQSRPEEGWYVFKNAPKGASLILPWMQFIATQAYKGPYTITFKLTSDADFDATRFNPYICAIELRILDKKQPGEDATTQP